MGSRAPEHVCKGANKEERKVNLCCDLSPAKPHTATRSLPHQQNCRENWKGKSQKTHGLR